jgi:hypothetical protein
MMPESRPQHQAAVVADEISTSNFTRTGTGSQQQLMHHDITTSTLLSTFVGCAAAAAITYPGELARMQWQKSALRIWDPEQHHTLMNMHSNSNSRSSSSNEPFFRKLRILTPMIRLLSNEMAGTALTSIITPTTAAESSNTNNANDLWKKEVVLAGAIAGCCQALLLSPIEAYHAHNLYMREQLGLYNPKNSWSHWLKSHLVEGGTYNPQERRARAFRGIQISAAREVVFNVTFFPLFHALQQQKLAQYVPSSLLGTTNGNDNDNNNNAINLVLSGIGAGTICSLAVTPMDIFKSYMMHSRERWHWWTGTQLVAPPLNMLARALILQAFCFGPAFGIVAAIYELT